MEPWLARVSREIAAGDNVAEAFQSKTTVGTTPVEDFLLEIVVVSASEWFLNIGTHCALDQSVTISADFVFAATRNLVFVRMKTKLFWLHSHLVAIWEMGAKLQWYGDLERWERSATTMAILGRNRFLGISWAVAFYSDQLVMIRRQTFIISHSRGVGFSCLQRRRET